MATLNAWMNGELVGAWTVERHAHAFTYASSWLESPYRRSLSLSLPISASPEIKGDVVRNYFDNLLPDNDRIRERLAGRFKTSSTEAFDLLQAIGRDCVGAVQLLPEGVTPEGWDRIQCVPLSEDEMAEALLSVTIDRHDDAQETDWLRISIAGAQEKTAFIFHRGRWCRPIGATPTTHIFKLPLGLIGGSRRVDANNSVENEWLCSMILAALGLPVAATEMATFGDQKVLIVERFDREWMDSKRWIARLPQEDFCQALGVAPNRKYQQDGGPGITSCMALLQGSQNRQDGTLFLLAQLAFFLMAATDGHAKNFSLYLNRGDAYEMTPLYDVISMWPYFGDAANQFRQRNAGLAMGIKSKSMHYRFHAIQTRHWKQLAMQYGGEPVWGAMRQLASSVEQALKSVEAELPDGFPAQVWETIARGMRNEADRFIGSAQAVARSE